MYKPKSRFILSRIKNTSFSNYQRSGYIDTLIFLERSITERICGWAGNIKLFYVRKQYRREFLTILKEIDPAGYKQLLHEEREAQKKEEEDARREKIEAEKKRQEKLQWWKKCGGKE